MPLKPRSLTPWGYIGRLRQERFERQRDELTAYLRAAMPLALFAERLYEEWREAVAEPIQDGQKAANASAVFWWQISNELRGFEEIVPPRAARRFHKTFVEALGNASQGAVIAKNGFRFNKYSMVGHGMGFLDRYVSLMSEAEAELARLAQEYGLMDDASPQQGEQLG